MKIHIWQFRDGNQGFTSEKGILETEIVNVQLLECHTGLVSGTPEIRVAKCVELNGKLREVRYAKYRHYDEPLPCVTLHSRESLPKGSNWTPAEKD